MAKPRYTLSDYTGGNYEVVDHAVRPARHVGVLPGPLESAYERLAWLNDELWRAPHDEVARILRELRSPED